MNPHAWALDPDALVIVPAAVATYAVVWRRWPASPPRVACFALGMLLLVAVFVTPLETIALHYLLAAHLLQNVVVAEWAPGLVVIGIAPSLAEQLERSAAVRALTRPVVALPLWLGTYFVWHAPWIYDTALEHQASLLHLEHASYFVAGALLWWPVVHGRMPDGAKALYLFAAFVLASPLGLLLALLPHPVYGFYRRAPRLWRLSHLADQEIAGVTMAVEQALVFFAVFAFYLTRFLRQEQLEGVYRGARP